MKNNSKKKNKNKKLLKYCIIILLFGFFILFFRVDVSYADYGDNSICGQPGSGTPLGYKCMDPSSSDVIEGTCIEGLKYTNIPEEMCRGECDGGSGCQRCCEPKVHELDDFILIVVGAAKWILGIAGSLALLFFIYGGVMFLISGGSSERVTKAKQIIIGAVIGLIIVFTSYMIIGFVMQSMGAVDDMEKWATTDWFK